MSNRDNRTGSEDYRCRNSQDNLASHQATAEDLVFLKPQYNSNRDSR